LQALLLAGGSGTRFWPASRRRRPKQLLPLVGDRSLVRLTLDRLLPVLDPGDVWVCTARELGEQVRRELPEVPERQILLEPVGRNTAPAIAWSLASMPPAARRDVVVSLHSDHWIEDEVGFRSTLLAAAAAAEGDRVVALGVVPRWAETGYGYLETTAAFGGPDRGGGGRADALRVLRFREKPDAATAEAFVAGGRHLWNAGIFAFRGDVLLDHLRRLEPVLTAAVAAAVADPARLDAIYERLASAPIDTAVMERLDELYTVVLDCGWSDLGSWAALAETLATADSPNAARGATVTIDASDNLLWSEEGLIAVLGVEGLAVVRSGNAVLVVPKARSQEVRRLVEELRRRGLDDLL
jgi:mannose-1-phosphate guanylyltransferase